MESGREKGEVRSLVIINHRPHGFDVEVKKYTVTYDLRVIYMEVGEP